MDASADHAVADYNFVIADKATAAADVDVTDLRSATESLTDELESTSDKPARPPRIDRACEPCRKRKVWNSCLSFVMLLTDQSTDPLHRWTTL